MNELGYTSLLVDFADEWMIAAMMAITVELSVSVLAHHHKVCNVALSLSV
jgi:hypothetical protein